MLTDQTAAAPIVDPPECSPPRYWRVFFPGEAMWVLPKSATTGILHNDPLSPLHDAKWGDEVEVAPCPHAEGCFDFVRVIPPTME